MHSAFIVQFTKNLALDYLKNAKEIVAEEKLNITLIGCGGITQQEHFDEFLKTGAKVAMTATGMMWGIEVIYVMLTVRSLFGSSQAVLLWDLRGHAIGLGAASFY